MTIRELWLLVDDDQAFLQVLARSLSRQGIETLCASDADSALKAIRSQEVNRCVLDLNLAGESGLQLLPDLLEHHPDLEVLVLTGYGSIATAVEAMRRGAANYLCKPVTVSQLMNGFEPLNTPPALRPEPPSVEEMEWEHIQRVLNEHDGNISATARALNMHRRTLQRKLQKHSRWR
ncbi:MULTISPECIES: response regulator transcription factor [unclassified Marinobacter]|uniref:response regulator transcription factor n=1 Tax=unclassified Marinobacter TaxID=83889 RepID=UPI000718CF3B|nr:MULTISPECIES: response regulator [unclassified Marinobacter]AMQ88943.1 two-component system response regulator [Marinobacter sp. LQ44]QFS85452.1 Photosynthetic apparatus regulatory protein RegA [Marinobacter sp. THAF197a]QFT49246.1 Photosynthetic apparatus regulatory protein RegA [Marinobacter sp. THAF39]